MTLSNKLTISRIFLAFIFMFFLFHNGVLYKIIAFILFVLASSTDYFDGFLARKRKEITNFGKIMDPIADKILTLSAFIAFVEMRLIPAWMIIIIILRELVITGLRLAALARNEVVAAEAVGKHKTVSQIVSILVILAFIVFREAGVIMFSFWDAAFEYWYRQTIFILMIFTTLLTIISGCSFIMKNRSLFINVEKG